MELLGLLSCYEVIRDIRIVRVSRVIRVIEIARSLCWKQHLNTAKFLVILCSYLFIYQQLQVTAK